MTTYHGSARLFTVLAALALITGCSSLDTRSRSPEPVGEPPMDTLVSAAWLEQHLNDPDLVVLDCSVLVRPDPNGAIEVVSGRADYLAGHIPGAGFADLLGELSDTDSALQFALPRPERFVAAMGNLGVGDDSRVVLYDASNGVWAARVWWMLRWAGFDRAALLDGGLAAWTSAGQPLETGPATRPCAPYGL